MQGMESSCFGCGSSNPAGQAYCGACGSPLAIREYVAQAVDTRWREVAKERDLVEKETAMNVFEKRLYATSDALAGKLVKQALEQHRQMVYNLQRPPADTYYISDMGNTTTLFFLLPETPLRNSLQLHFEQIPAAPASVFIHHNLVAVFTPSSRAALLSQFISVSYCAESTDQMRFRSVTVSKEPCCVALLHCDDGRLQVPGLRADGQPTEWLDSINDAFVGGLLPREDQ